MSAQLQGRKYIQKLRAKIWREVFILQDHKLRVDHVLPPVVVYSISAARHSREMIEPPFVVLTDVAAAPFRGTDDAHVAFEAGEI